MKLAKTYHANETEPIIYAMWETARAFEPSGQGDPYCVVMPPPNANGNLHIGHALTVGLQDILVRYYRMKGRDTVYIPGADHAGLETWVVFERALNAKGQSRFDFSREELYKMVWDFVAKERGQMELQLRALGVSCSWEDLVFTLDKKVIDGVYQTFERLWNDGLIYRGERIINYSTKYQTGYADIEVDYREVKGTLYNVAYTTIDKIGEITVATTRPETIFGDVAIAVHPEDERYKDLIGASVLVPVINREIPIVADEAVDMEFGTGAVKVTPAHDALDFEIGQRHDLEPIRVIDWSGKMINVPAGFEGLTPEEARKKMVKVLAVSEALRSQKTITHVVGFDYKSGLPIEPMLKDQWFLKVEPLVKRAKQALKQGEITFYPASRQRVLERYLDNLRDWNLSRQIAWGIPIPAFRNQQNSKDWIFDTRVDQEKIEVNGKTYIREEDTFDTWFSSGQWPFLVTDYLEGGDLARFYPTSLMETGADLLDRWVARMIMLGLYATDKVPFKEVYMHGMVLDEQGQKMSKSKGNVINPMQVVGEYGSDALRIGVVSNRSAGQNQAFSTAKVVAGRNFCNKLWNIARFTQDKLPADFKPQAPEQIECQTLADHWMVRQLDQATAKVEEHLANYRLSEACETVYHLVWDSLADWYLEASKVDLSPQVLVYALETCLKLAHPFAPFVTESLWQALDWRSGLLMTSAFPIPNQLVVDSGQVSQFESLIEITKEARYLNAELPGNKNYDLLYVNDSLISAHSELLAHLGHLAEVRQIDQPTGIRIAGTKHNCWLDVDADTLYKHQNNLEMRLLDHRGQAAKLANRLSNENYIKKAPAHLVEETKQQLEAIERTIERLEKELEVLH